MKLNPHLSFNGQCEAAFEFYKNCFGGEIITMMTCDRSPSTGLVADDWGKKIIHATLAFGDLILTGADSPPDHFQQPQGFELLLHVSSQSEAERIFAALSEKGVVKLPLQETFWALRFGMLVDQFGIPWSINCGKAT